MRPFGPLGPPIGTQRSRGNDSIHAFLALGSTRSTMIVSVLSVASRPTSTGSFGSRPASSSTPTSKKLVGSEGVDCWMIPCPSWIRSMSDTWRLT